MNLMERLGLTKPVVLAPMAGGFGTPELVGAVSNAGSLGSSGAAYLTPEQIREVGRAIRERTDRAFNLNLFAPHALPDISEEQTVIAIDELAPMHAALDLPTPSLPEKVQEDFQAQFEAVLDVRPAVFSFAFGRVDTALLENLRQCGILSIGTATSPVEARRLEADGVDAVVVQGGAAGGHRGGWMQDDLADTLHLVRETVQVVRIPVVAAGGLMTRQHVRAALDAGASLAQCGTAFLRAHEAGTSAAHRQALAQADAGDTTLTTSFSGRPARGLRNLVTEQVQQPLPYPYQNALTRQMRNAAAQQGRPEFLSLWTGVGAWEGREGSAADILASLCP